MNNLFVSINDVLNQVKLDLGKMDNRQDTQLISWIIQGIRDLALAGASLPKAVILPINHKIKTVNLPTDYFDWCRVGLECEQGIKFLTQATNYAKVTRRDDCGDEDIAALESCCHEPNLEFENTFGKFSIDIAQGRIILDSRIQADNIYFEYISDGTEIDGKVMLRQAALAALRAYVHLQDAMFPRVKQDFSVRDMTYKQEKRLLHRANNAISIADIREVIQNNRHNFPK